MKSSTLSKAGFVPLLVASLVTLVGGTAMADSARAAAIDPFYSTLLVEGRLALARRDFTNAAKDLRTASFGALEEPAVLSEALVLLAVSQAASGAEAGFRETFSRLLEVEQRFAAYDSAKLSAAERSAFQAEAIKRIPAPSLTSAPAFARFVAAPEKGTPAKPSRRRSAPADAAEPQRPAPPADATQRPAAQKPSAPEPGPPKPAPAKPSPPKPTAPAATDAPPATAPRTPSAPGASPAASAAPTPPAATAPAPAGATRSEDLTPEDQAIMDAARRRMEQAKTLAELSPALQAMFPLADRRAHSAAAQRLAAELAYRASRWSDVARFAGRLTIDPAADPALCFYAGAAEAELGHRDAAAALLRRCAPYLERTPVVARYLDHLEPVP
jgi:hypothetical protein